MAMRVMVRLQIYRRFRAAHHHHHVHRHSTNHLLRLSINHLQLRLLRSSSNPQLRLSCDTRPRNQSCTSSGTVVGVRLSPPLPSAAWPTIFESRATAPRSTSSCSNTASNSRLILPNGGTRIGPCLITDHALHLRRRHTQSRPAHPPLVAAVDVAAVAVVLEAMLGAQGVEEKVTVMAGARRRARKWPWMQARPRGPAMPSA